MRARERKRESKEKERRRNDDDDDSIVVVVVFCGGRARHQNSRTQGRQKDHNALEKEKGKIPHERERMNE